MGIDYSSGTGYGIAIELHEDTEETLITMFNELLGTGHDPEDGIWGLQGERKLAEMGLAVDHVGDSWSGTEQYVLVLLRETSQSHNHRDAGVWMVNEKARDIHRLNPIIEALKGKGIKYRGPGWMVHKSVT